MAKFANQMKVKGRDPLNELRLAIITVGHQIADRFRQAGAVLLEMLKIPINPRFIRIIKRLV